MSELWDELDQLIWKASYVGCETPIRCCLQRIGIEQLLWRKSNGYGSKLLSLREVESAFDECFDDRPSNTYKAVVNNINHTLSRLTDIELAMMVAMI